MPKDKNKKRNESLAAIGALGDGAKDTNTFFGTFIHGILSAGQSVSLQTTQSYNAQSLVQIALSVITVPLAVYDLFNKYKELNELKNKDFTQFQSHENRPSYRHPKNINTEIFSLKKIQLSSSAINILIALAFTSIVVASIFTGGLALGVIAVVALGVGITKGVMDLYLQEKEKRLSKEFFESKVLHKMAENEIDAYEQLDPKYKPVFIAIKALSLNDNNDFSETEVKNYLLNNRQGYFENEKMRNTQFALGALSMSLWLTLCFVTAGIGGVIALGVTTLLSVGLSIVNTEKVQSLLSPKVTEWFRTVFSSKKDGDFEAVDYKNKNINDVINDLKKIEKNTLPKNHPLTEALNALNHSSGDSHQAPSSQYNSSATILIELNKNPRDELKETTPTSSNHDHDKLNNDDDSDDDLDSSSDNGDVFAIAEAPLISPHC